MIEAVRMLLKEKYQISDTVFEKAGEAMALIEPELQAYDEIREFQPAEGVKCFS